MDKSQLLYSPTEIRTSNMVPDRSTDMSFPEDSSLTQQQFADECDINNIIRRHPDGLFTHVNPGTPKWGVDVPEPLAYNEALNLVMEADAAFMALPAELRARFNNDASSLLAFLNDETNRDEAIKLGLVNPPASVEASTSTPVDKTPETPSDAA